MTLEEMVLENLIGNEEFTRSVLPFLKKAYFEDDTNKFLFQKIQEFVTKYNVLPPKNSLDLEIKNTQNVSQTMVDSSINRVATLYENIKTNGNREDVKWLKDKTEKWCQERALYLAIFDSIQIIDGKKKQNKNSIPQLLTDALAVAFDSDLGHDYTEDSDKRFEFLHSDVPRIPLDLEMYNTITRNGAARKTLNIIGAGVNVGKTLHLCHFTCAYALQGYKVLYISLEMAQEEISSRLDANLMDVDIDKIPNMSKEEWDSKIARIRKKARGNIIIKEYPTKQASSVQFKAFLRELKIKKNFVPDVICVDYLGICSAASLKLGGSINTNTYQGQIAAELRALAKEYNIVVWTAQQLNRTGFASSDPDMDNVADSFDVPGIADFYLMVTQSEELAKLNQYQVKQVKSRYGDKNKNRRFVIGVDKAKMRLYDTSSSSQTLVNGDHATNNARPPFKKLENKFSQIKV
jgi:replicative DNA helicase